MYPKLTYAFMYSRYELFDIKAEYLPQYNYFNSEYIRRNQYIYLFTNLESIFPAKRTIKTTALKLLDIYDSDVLMDRIRQIFPLLAESFYPTLFFLESRSTELNKSKIQLFNQENLYEIVKASNDEYFMTLLEINTSFKQKTAKSEKTKTSSKFDKLRKKAKINVMNFNIESDESENVCFICSEVLKLEDEKAILVDKRKSSFLFNDCEIKQLPPGRNNLFSIEINYMRKDHLPDETDDNCILISCPHRYHKKCIDKMQKCPYCKFKFNRLFTAINDPMLKKQTKTREILNYPDYLSKEIMTFRDLGYINIECTTLTSITCLVNTLKSIVYSKQDFKDRMALLAFILSTEVISNYKNRTETLNTIMIYVSCY